MSSQDPVPMHRRYRINDEMTVIPRAFILQRDIDESGVSGVGVVAWGVEFPDGVCALRWTSQWPTSVVFHERGMESIKAVHGHDGKTRVIFMLDEEFEKVKKLFETASAILPNLPSTDARNALAKALRAFSPVEKDSPSLTEAEEIEKRLSEGTGKRLGSGH